MAVIVSYDLHKDGQEYEKLYEQLHTYSWCHPQQSVWILDTDKPAAEVRDHLKQYVDANDTLMVLGLNGNWAVNGAVAATVKKWLKDRWP